MSDPSPISRRFKCPCCNYPTLTEQSAYEICELCNWEDDGQGESAADQVRGGPNSDYSLTEARANFAEYRVMYAPGRDQRITNGDSEREYKTKGKLMVVFDRWGSASDSDRRQLEEEIFRLERVLQDETQRQVQEYEDQIERDA